MYFNHFSETLRIYSPVGLVGRMCRKEYAVPDTTLVLKVGDIILISLYGLHYDEEYHPNPEVFDPERFAGAKKDFTFLPFSEGPRNCIGKLCLFQKYVGNSTFLDFLKIFLCGLFLTRNIFVHTYVFVSCVFFSILLNSII